MIKWEAEVDAMGNHGKKMIAPIVVTVLIVLYLIGFSIAAFIILPSAWVWIVFGGVPLICAGVMIAVCVQRMKEIRSGEEDDLSKY